MTRDQQGDVDQRLRQPVAERVLLADGLQLVDKVEKEKQAQETERDEADGNQYLVVDQAANGLHLRGNAVVRRRERLQLLSRLSSQPTPIRKAPPCRASMKPPML